MRGRLGYAFDRAQRNKLSPPGSATANGRSAIPVQSRQGGSGLAGTIKLGGLYHFGKFYDQLFDVDGQPLALPSSSGIAKTYRGNYSFYGVIDQMLWRLPGDDPKKGVGAFARVAISPTDRNLVDFYADAGINFIGLWDKRPDDSFGIAASFTHLSPNVRQPMLIGHFLRVLRCPCANMNWSSN